MRTVTHRRVVSGGSTLTMQVARLLEPRPARSLSDKLAEMIRAVQIERRLSKPQILDLYLALAPYGGNIEGLRAASLAYFGKEPKRLSTAEYARLPNPPQSLPCWLQTTPSHARPITLPVIDLPVKSCATSRGISDSGSEFHRSSRLRR